MFGMPARRLAPRKGSGVRAAVATAEVVAFSAVAHAAAGGDVARVELLLALAAVAGVVSLGLRHRLVALPVAAGIAVLAQPVLHLAFSAGGTHGGHAAPAALAGFDTHMLLAHGLSAVGTVLALRWQEQVLVAAAHWLTGLLPAELPPLPGFPEALTSTGRSVRPRLVIVDAPRRGPPARTPVTS
jgi:hypothetical protein